MLGMFFDILALCSILFFVDREESSDIYNLAVAVIIMTVANLAIGLALAPTIGILALAPMMAVWALVIRTRFTLTWKKTSIVVFSFLAAKIAFMAAIHAMFS